MRTLRQVTLSEIAVPGNSRMREFMLEMSLAEASFAHSKANPCTPESFMADFLFALTPRGEALCLLPGGDLLNWALRKLESGERFEHSSDLVAMMVSPKKETVLDALGQTLLHSRNTLLICALRYPPNSIPHGSYRNLELFGDPIAGTLTFWQAKRFDNQLGLQICGTGVGLRDLAKAAREVADGCNVDVSVANEPVGAVTSEKAQGELVNV